MQFQGHPKKYESVLLNRPVCLPHQAAKISANEKNSKIPQEIPCRIRAAIRMCVISIVISLPHFKLKIPKNKNQAVCVKTQHLLDLSASLFSSRSSPPPLQASRSRSNPPPHHAHTASSAASRSRSNPPPHHVHTASSAASSITPALRIYFSSRIS